MPQHQVDPGEPLYVCASAGMCGRRERERSRRAWALHDALLLLGRCLDAASDDDAWAELRKQL